MGGRYNVEYDHIVPPALLIASEALREWGSCSIASVNTDMQNHLDWANSSHDTGHRCSGSATMPNSDV
jgi:hypothetical protein